MTERRTKMRNLIDPCNCFFMSIWCRILIICVTVGWGLVEIYNNNQLWGILFCATGFYCTYIFIRNLIKHAPQNHKLGPLKKYWYVSLGVLGVLLIVLFNVVFNRSYWCSDTYGASGFPIEINSDSFMCQVISQLQGKTLYVPIN